MELTNEELKPWEEEIIKSVLPYVSIKATNVRTDPGLTKSKFGGIPFLLDPEKYPKTSSGAMLLLLAQINFSEVPSLEGFPKDGLLQLFVLNDDMIGFNDSDLTKQNTFRVIYFPKEDLVETNAIRDYNWPKQDNFYVFKGVFKLEFSLNEAPITIVDYRYGKRMTMNWFDDLSKEAQDYYWELTKADEHKIGGYPSFTQDDPRYGKSPYTTLLFQMSSQYFKDDPDNEIMWGDMGVANFFIKPEDLKNLKFDDVIYSWDCS